MFNHGSKRSSLPAVIGALFCLLLSIASSATADDSRKNKGLHPQLLASGLLGASGATIGPDGALYAVEGAVGKVTRIDLRNGRKHTIATGLPATIPEVGLGGAMDVEFIGRTAYVLTTLVGQFGGPADGIYRVNSKYDVELIADLGTFSRDNPPATPFDLSDGVQFAMQPLHDGFLVTDGHHNRVLHATLDGHISVLKQFDNIVPTGLAGSFGTAYIGQLGAVPNPPEEGKVLAIGLVNPDVDLPAVASGVSMIVDVEVGPDGALYALSQGDLGSEIPGAPAAPDTGRLLKVKQNGTFKVLADGVNWPTSLNFSPCGDALVVTLSGDVLRYRNVAKPACRGCGKPD
ncbi:MAG: ScyD/ScyE family protein [Pseudomonadales bacterium]